jgi:hypothetical protein
MAMSLPREVAERLDTWREYVVQMQEVCDRIALRKKTMEGKCSQRGIMVGIEIAIGAYDKFMTCSHSEYLEMRKIMLRTAGDPLQDVSGILCIKKVARPAKE